MNEDLGTAVPNPMVRTRGNRSVRVFGLLLLAGVGAWLLVSKVFMQTPPALGRIHAMAALADRSAVAVVGTDSGDFVVKLDASGGASWSSKLPRAARTIGANDGMAVTGDVIAVRNGGPHSLALSGYSIADGRRLWDTLVATTTRESEITAGVFIGVTAAAGAFFVVYDNQSSGKQEIVAIDSSTGAILSRRPLGARFAPIATTSRLVLQDVGRADVIDPRGATSELDSWMSGCAIGDSYVRVAGVRVDDDGVVGDVATPRLVALSDASERNVIFDLPFPRWSHMKRCGRFGKRLVALVSVSGSVSETHVLVLDETGALVHDIDLGSDMQLDGGWVWYQSPGVASLSGELTRFVLYVLDTYDPDPKEKHTRLIMLDLETGKIAWQGPSDHALIHGTLFRHGTSWLWVHNQMASPVIAVFDGATGKLTRAVLAHAYDGVGEIKPSHAVDGALWLYTKELTPSPWNELPVAMLDAATLETRSVRGIELTDVTAEFQQYLDATPEPSTSRPTNSAP